MFGFLKKPLPLTLVTALSACSYHTERPGHVADVVSTGILAGPQAAVTAAVLTPAAEAVLGENPKLANSAGWANTCGNAAIATGAISSYGALLVPVLLCGMVTYSEAEQ